MTQHFFRQEAMRTNLNHLYGATYAIAAFPHQTFTFVLCALLPLSLIFILVTPYTEQYTLRGYLDSNQGIASVYPTKSGILGKYRVETGQHVKKGDILFSVNTNNLSLNSVEQSLMIKQLQQRKNHLLQSLRLKKQHIQAIKPLLLKKYISQSMYQHEIDEMITFEQSITDITQTLANYHHAKQYVVQAPVSGIITNIVSQTGQQVQPTQSILDIVPDKTTLIARLMIPVTQIGYIHLHDVVSFHYDAYPDQYTQLVTGHIQDISKTLSTESNLLMPQHAAPYYKATVGLTRSTILIDGQEHPLQLGMTCSAVVQGARKKIWQWLVAPLRRFHHPDQE